MYKKYEPVEGFVIGRLRIKNSKLPVVVPLDGSTKKIYIYPEFLNFAMGGDDVQVKIFDEYDGKIFGVIEKIIKQKKREIFGVVVAHNGELYLKHKNKFIHGDIKLSHDSKKFVGVGSTVKAKIVQRSPFFVAKIFEVRNLVEPKNFDSAEIRPIKEEFPEKVFNEAKKIETEPNEAEILNRADRRNFQVITIDGEDAKDLDDGVFAKKIDSGYFLGVYIADVSYYVKENSAIDLEALERGTSIYLIEKVIPMLPFELSNGICSLYENVNRFVMACEMNLNFAGQVTSYKIFPATIRVQKNLTYTAVNKFFDGDTDELKNFSYNLNTLKEIYNLRKNIRVERGAVDFDFPEFKIRLDDKKNPVAIEKRTRRIAEKIIEECMLVANETVATYTAENKIPSLYRVHENPSPEKIEQFNLLAAHFGTHINISDAKNFQPKNMQNFINKIKNHPAENIISRYALRTMKNADYRISNDGHFGLAAKFYTHFTSPIRRYPDLIVHRMLRASFETPEKISEMSKKLSSTAEKSSACERQAEKREYDDFDEKATEYMKKFIGEKFDAMIDGIIESGFFVELENGVSGLVPVMSLCDDYYNYIEKEFAMIGEFTGRTFRIGDSVRVRLVRAETSTHHLTFELVEEVVAKDLIVDVYDTI